MNTDLVGKVFDIQKFTVNDGPGIRTEIFLKGCPLKCLWCHSPESQAFEAQVAWFSMRCIGVEDCGKCLQICPAGALRVGAGDSLAANTSDRHLVDRDTDLCDNCGKCTDICPAKALCMTGVDMSVDEVMHIVEKDRSFYLKSGGGVTISGGEPMAQHAFTTALLRECKARGLHTCLDTTGFAKWVFYREAIPYVDLVLYDLKHMDSKISQELVGVPNARILENARRLAAEGIALQIRIPIIPGYNDSEQNLRATSEFCLELGSAVKLVQILPYHRLGTVKYERLHKDYQLEEVRSPSPERMESIKVLIESYGLEVQIH